MTKQKQCEDCQAVMIDAFEGCSHCQCVDAVVNDDTPRLRELIAQNADVDAANFNGETPFSYACANNRLEAAKVLHAAGADINAVVDTAGGRPLDWAVCWSSPEFRNWLISIGGKRTDTHQPPPWPRNIPGYCCECAWDLDEHGVCPRCGYQGEPERQANCIQGPATGRPTARKLFRAGLEGLVIGSAVAAVILVGVWLVLGTYRISHILGSIVFGLIVTTFKMWMKERR